ncbi:MAG: cytochrome C oxidase subunit IV family protein [Myxococcales bacterium]|nr:cytochrome C oxidase subunit IV family protein [Myxococcales bacterium]
MSHHDHEHADDGAVHSHVSSTAFYAGIFLALVFFTVVTVAVSYVHLGPANLAVAIAIASVKATLVVLFFMHLRWDAKFNSLILVSTLGFIGIFFAFTFTDTEWRTKQYSDTQGTKILPADGTPAPGGMPPRPEKKDHGAAGAAGHGQTGAPAGHDKAAAPASSAPKH